MIQTTTVGSYSPIDWLAALPSEQAVLDATSVVINTQRNAGIDLPTDQETVKIEGPRAVHLKAANGKGSHLLR